MVVEAFVTAPMADLTLTVGQPLGYTVNNRAPVSMGALGALATTLFESVGASTQGFRQFLVTITSLFIKKI